MFKLTLYIEIIIKEHSLTSTFVPDHMRIVAKRKRKKTQSKLTVSSSEPRKRRHLMRATSPRVYQEGNVPMDMRSKGILPADILMMDTWQFYGHFPKIIVNCPGSPVKT